jgi:hypothetical protein
MDIPWSIKNGMTTVKQDIDHLLEIALRNIKLYAGLTVPPNFNVESLLRQRYASKPDSKGYAKLEKDLFGMKNSLQDEIWYRRFDSYFLIGTGRSLVETVSSKMRIEKSGHPNQISLNLGDFSKSSLGSYLRAEAYVRDRRVSAGNALLLHVYQQQLQPQDLNGALKCIQDQSLLCPLGGKFVAADQNQPDRWKSTAWSEETLYQTNQVPKNYSQVLIDELNSMRIEFSMDPDTLKTRLEIQTKAKK